jgi:hypothetical protein
MFVCLEEKLGPQQRNGEDISATKFCFCRFSLEHSWAGNLCNIHRHFSLQAVNCSGLSFQCIILLYTQSVPYTRKLRSARPTGNILGRGTREVVSRTTTKIPALILGLENICSSSKSTRKVKWEGMNVQGAGRKRPLHRDPQKETHQMLQKMLKVVTGGL